MKVVRVSPALLDLLRERRIFHQLRRGDRWRVGQLLGVAPTAKIEPYSNILAGDYIPLAFGAFSYSHSLVRPHVSIGRYCSVGEQVAWMGGNHPMDWATTSAFLYDSGNLQGVGAYHADQGTTAQLRTLPPTGSTIVGNDVWIGDGAMIAAGVTIGDGAVIGARALVLKNVAPYSIVVGSPAKVLRYRFSGQIIERLLAAKWWRFGPDALQVMDPENPEVFLQCVETCTAGPLDLAPLTWEQIAAAVT